jgi:phosphoserine aminotransferase
MNLLGGSTAGCDIADIGYWSQRAVTEASKYTDTVHTPVTVQDEPGIPLSIPDRATWSVRPDAVSLQCASPAVPQCAVQCKRPRAAPSTWTFFSL